MTTMTTTEFSQSRYQGAATGLRHFVETAAARVAVAWKSYSNRRSVTRLLEFDERMLRDIGLTRNQVRHALATRFDEDPSYRLTVFSASHYRHRECTARRDV
jgi:uncharacterized protein YjiS (DUF1127 family)